MTAPLSALWRDDVDALQFHFEESERSCLIHRLAFKALLNATPNKHSCLAFFQDNSGAFLSAAVKKAARAGQPEKNIHITSRDIARILSEAETVTR